MNINKVIVGGNLTRDPELRYIPSGTAVLNFSIANNRRFKSAAGDTKEETAFIDCEAWDSGAETIAKYFKKGDAILLEGRLKMDTWETENGKRSRLKLRVEQFHFPQKSRGQRAEESEDDAQESNEGSDANELAESLPF